MNLPDAAERTVFPKLISVSQLKVRKAVLEVVAQCGQVQKFVFQKVMPVPRWQSLIRIYLE